MKKKIAIIGANSYIARNVTESFCQLSEQFELLLYDYQSASIDSHNNYIQIDILSAESVKQIDLSCDVVFMFVGKTGSANGFDQFNEFIKINESSLLTLLNEFRYQNSKAKLVFPSTRLVYKGCPGEVKEDSQKEFKTIYAINKFSCENYLQMFHNMYGISYCTLRICIPYGTLVPNATSYGTAEFMVKKASAGKNITLYGDGSQRRTLTYMGDLCRIIIKAALSEQCINNVYNVGGEDYSLLEMAELIASKYKVNVESIPWPIAAQKIESGDTVFNSEKLDARIGKTDYTKFSDWCTGQFK